MRDPTPAEFEALAGAQRRLDGVGSAGCFLGSIAALAAFALWATLGVGGRTGLTTTATIGLAVATFALGRSSKLTERLLPRPQDAIVGVDPEDGRLVVLRVQYQPGGGTGWFALRERRDGCTLDARWLPGTRGASPEGPGAAGGRRVLELGAPDAARLSRLVDDALSAPPLEVRVMDGAPYEVAVLCPTRADVWLASGNLCGDPTDRPEPWAPVHDALHAALWKALGGLSVRQGPRSSHVCGCCGKTSHVLRGEVRDELGAVRAAYVAGYTEGHPGIGSLLFSLGPRGPGTGPADRIAVLLRVEPSGFTVEGPADCLWPDVADLGRIRERVEVIDTPLAREVFHLSDHVWVEDTRFSAFFRRA